VDINNRGEATGTGGDANGVQHAALWENGVVTILETLPDAAESHGNSINDKGQVTGQSCSAQWLARLHGFRLAERYSAGS
jgi:uncharacterized membrane protein